MIDNYDGYNNSDDHDDSEHDYYYDFFYIMHSCFPRYIMS